MLLPDSLHWYVATQQKDKAHEWIERARRFNHVMFSIDEVYTEPNINQQLLPATGTDERKQEQPNENLLHICTSLPLTVQTIIMMYLWCVEWHVHLGAVVSSCHVVTLSQEYQFVFQKRYCWTLQPLWIAPVGAWI
jgi:hypothetical protein